MAGEQVAVGLDIGTTKVCTLIGEVKVPHRVQIVGVGIAPSRGLRKGLVVDMEEAVGAIASSLKKAETFSGYQIIGAMVAVSGSHLDSEAVHGSLTFPREKQLSQQEMAEVLARVAPKESRDGRRLLHMMTRGYSVDGENGIANPVGMLATRLEVDGLVVSSAAGPYQNLARCVEKAGIQIDGPVCAGLASAEGVLSDPERQLGVLLIDMGGGTTDLVWFRDGEAQYVGALPVGGNHLTNDLAVGLGVPFSAAEEIKLRFACAVPNNVTEEETLDAGSFSDGQVRKVSRRFMAEIVEARAAEIFELSLEELGRRGFDGVLPAGVVLTGGTAQLRGIRELAQQIFKVPVRVGLPEGLAGLTDSVSTPAYSTAAGLLKWVVTQPDDVAGSRPLRRRVGLGARLRSLIKAFLP